MKEIGGFCLRIKKLELLNLAELNSKHETLLSPLQKSPAGDLRDAVFFQALKIPVHY